MAIHCCAQDPSLELAAKHDYSEPGKYTVVVKVVDILGNDTTKALAAEIAAPKAKVKGA